MRRHDCPSCGSGPLFTHRVSSGGGYAPQLLPGLGSLFKSPRVDVYACSRCGHLTLEVPEEFRSKLAESGKWRRV